MRSALHHGGCATARLRRKLALRGGFETLALRVRARHRRMAAAAGAALAVQRVWRGTKSRRRGFPTLGFGHQRLQQWRKQTTGRPSGGLGGGPAQPPPPSSPTPLVARGSKGKGKGKETSLGGGAARRDGGVVAAVLEAELLMRPAFRRQARPQLRASCQALIAATWRAHVVKHSTWAVRRLRELPKGIRDGRNERLRLRGTYSSLKLLALVQRQGYAWKRWGLFRWKFVAQETQIVRSLQAEEAEAVEGWVQRQAAGLALLAFYRRSQLRLDAVRELRRRRAQRARDEAERLQREEQLREERALELLSPRQLQLRRWLDGTIAQGTEWVAIRKRLQMTAVEERQARHARREAEEAAKRTALLAKGTAGWGHAAHDAQQATAHAHGQQASRPVLEVQLLAAPSNPFARVGLAMWHFQEAGWEFHPGWARRERERERGLGMQGQGQHVRAGGADGGGERGGEGDGEGGWLLRQTHLRVTLVTLLLQTAVDDGYGHALNAAAYFALACGHQALWERAALAKSDGEDGGGDGGFLQGFGGGSLGGGDGGDGGLRERYCLQRAAAAFAQARAPQAPPPSPALLP
jgi:hypothetical protein